jgi:hypothetical protein
MKIRLIIVLLTFQLSAFAQDKSGKSIVPCPLPRFKKGQTAAQVNEESRIYVECKKNQEREKKTRMEVKVEILKRNQAQTKPRKSQKRLV